MALSDVGSLSANSSSRTPVSATRFDAVSTSASCPVATRREETLGIPYVYGLIVSRCLALLESIWVPYLEECKYDSKAEEMWKF